jgi:methionine biosynthesis protein MetW
MRIDQQLAEKWIKPDSSVLDLGCGDGELLAHMSKKHNIRAYGLEIDQEKIAIAVSRGLNIIQQDLNLGLSRFADQSFDYVVMAQALQAVDAPDVLLRDMVRVGNRRLLLFQTLRIGRLVLSCIKRNDACFGSFTVYVV